MHFDIDGLSYKRYFFCGDGSMMEAGTTMNILDPSHVTQMGDNLWQLYQGKQLCDVTLMSTDGRTIRAHWVILCATSEYFRSMMNCIQIDAQVILLDVPSEILQPIVEYLYTGKIQVASNNYQHIIKVAKFQKLNHLAELVEERLSQIQNENQAKIISDIKTEPGICEDVRYQDSAMSASSYVVSENRPTKSRQQYFYASEDSLETEYETSSYSPTKNNHTVSKKRCGVRSEVAKSKNTKNEKNTKSEKNTVIKEKLKKFITTKALKKSPQSSRLKKCVKPSVKVAQNLVTWYKQFNMQRYVGSTRRNTRVYLCRKCKSVFTSRQEWKTHYQVSPCNKRATVKTKRRAGSSEKIMKPRTERFHYLSGNLHHFEFFHCPECEEMFKTRSFLRVHMTDHHGYTYQKVSSFMSMMFRCDVEGCSFKGDNVKSLTSHMASFHPNNLYGCSKCHLEFRVRQSLQRHLKLVHTDRKRYLHSCSYCEKLFMKVRDKEAHEKIKHGVNYPIQLHTCILDGCDFQTRSRAMLQGHMKTHSENKTMLCTYCGRPYKSRQGLSKHVRETHISVPQFLCQICGVSMKSKYYLEQHTHQQHGDADKYNCHLCIFETLSRRNLADHTYHKHRVKAHFDTREILHCDQCPDYSTVNASRMRKHMNSAHSEVRNSVCDECPKSFKSDWELRLHKQMHSVSKSFQCPECEFSCKFRGSLDKHIKLQHWFRDYKPYLCVYCGFGSNMMVKVRSHVRQTHRGKEVQVKTDHEVKMQMKAIMMERKKQEKLEESELCE